MRLISPPQLAATLLSQLDPTVEEGGGPEAESDPLLIPTYTQPKAVYAVLPGNDTPPPPPPLGLGTLFFLPGLLCYSFMFREIAYCALKT